MDAVAESGKEKWSPRVSIRFSLGVENERADPGRNGLTCLARSNSQARKWTGKINFPVQLTTSRIDNHTYLMSSLLYVIIGWTKKGTKGTLHKLL